MTLALIRLSPRRRFGGSPVAKRKANTTERGLGYAHQQARRALPPPEGFPCPYCARPMWPDQQLDADHVVPRAVGGGPALRWAHSSCNRRAGGVLGGRLRRSPERWLDQWA